MSSTLPPSSSSSQPPPPLPPPITIKVLAGEVRRRAIPALGEAAFARLCMEFDRRVDPTSNDYVRYIRIVEILALEGPTDATIMQLGLVWLDGHGYGGWTIEELGQELERVRQEFKQRE